MTGLAGHLTLRQRLLALVALAIVPPLAALIYFILAIHAERERDVRGQALRTSELAALEISRIVSGADGILKTLAIAPSVRHLAPDCDSVLAEVAARLPQLRGFLVADATGTVRCAAGFAYGPEGVSGQSWFQPALERDGLVVGDYTRSQPGEAPYLPVALATDGDAARQILMTGIDLGWLGALLRERNPTPGSSLAVADRNGTLIAREPEPDRFVGTSVAAEFLPLLTADRPGSTDVVGRDGVARILGYQPLASTALGLFVAAGFSTKAAFAPIYASTWRSLALAGAGALAAFGLAWWAGDRFFRAPILRLLATIASWRAGDDTARSGLRSDGTEIAALARSIDQYMDNLVEVRAERAKAEEHRALLLREMTHRIKNILAAVQAIANQTFKGQATAESLGSFGSRLQAMAAAHDLLVSRNWSSAELRRTIEAALAPFGADRPGRFSLDGPPVRITAKAALALSLALHELATNAAKYGALSGGEGEVEIRWRLAAGPDDTPERFHLSWTETGGPLVTAPQRRGFGTRLIETALAGELAARADLAFLPDGLCFTLDAGVAGLVTEAAEPIADD